jgi:hypothetical protein
MGLWRVPHDEFEPPQGVQLAWPDGRTVKIPIVYVGWIKDSHQWEMVLTDDLIAGLVAGEARLRVQRLPGRTSLCMPITWADLV